MSTRRLIVTIAVIAGLVALTALVAWLAGDAVPCITAKCLEGM